MGNGGRSARGLLISTLTDRLRGEWPQLAGPAFRDQVAAMVARAIGHGFRDKAPIAAWASLECRYGAGFEALPAFASVREVLALDLGAATKLYKIGAGSTRRVTTNECFFG